MKVNISITGFSFEMGPLEQIVLENLEISTELTPEEFAAYTNLAQDMVTKLFANNSCLDRK